MFGFAAEPIAIWNEIQSNRQLIDFKRLSNFIFAITRDNSEAREWRHDSDKTQTNKLELWMSLNISLRAKEGVPKRLVERKFRLPSLYSPQNTLLLTESRGEFSDLHSIFRLRALRYCGHIFRYVEAADFQLTPLVPSGRVRAFASWKFNPLNFHHIKPKGGGMFIKRAWHVSSISPVVSFRSPRHLIYLSVDHIK